MVDFEKLMKQPPMTDAERDKLWQDWYDDLPESEKRVVNKEKKRDFL